MLERPPQSCAIVVSWLRRLAVAIRACYQVYLVQRARRVKGVLLRHR